jgi:NaMN:DMB phosphoribosyltransferase
LRIGSFNLAVGTTKWIAYDPSVNTKKLAQIIQAPCACSHLDFSQSCHQELKAYESGHVKEGVGAGAAMLVAALTGLYSQQEIIRAIDQTFDEIIRQ